MYGITLLVWFCEKLYFGKEWKESEMVSRSRASTARKGRKLSYFFMQKDAGTSPVELVSKHLK